MRAANLASRATRESMSTVHRLPKGLRPINGAYVLSPYRDVVLKEFQRHKVQLNMDVEMPTVETIRLMVQRNEGVAFLPHMCVEQDVAQDALREIKVKELAVDRKIRLVCPAKRSLSHAAKAFLELVKAS